MASSTRKMTAGSNPPSRPTRTTSHNAERKACTRWGTTRNIHSLWFAATADGQSLATKVDDAALRQMFMLAGFRVVPYWALTRFGRWDEMLREPPVEERFKKAWERADFTLSASRFARAERS